MGDLNEFQTRKQKIDVLLHEQGWNVNDRSKVVLEVDTKQSDFKKQDYKRVNETRRNDSESKYADYLLLDSTGKPLAIIEAKRTPTDRKGDIPDIIDRFRKRREENPTDRKGKCFYVPAEEIKANNYDLSISRYKEIEYEEVRYEKPEIIIEKIEELEGRILENIDELKWLLGKEM